MKELCTCKAKFALKQALGFALTIHPIDVAVAGNYDVHQQMFKSVQLSLADITLIVMNEN